MNFWLRLLSLFFLAGYSSFVSGQSSIRLSGKILADDLSPLMNASVYIAQFSSGTVSDSMGDFQVDLKPGWNEVSFSYIGYNAEMVRLFLSHDTTIEIKLKTNLQLNEVTIVDKKMMLNALHEA